MKALVIYDSLFGNTEKIARAIGDALAARTAVSVLRVADVKPGHLAGVGLLVVGAPTHGGRPSPAMKSWLQALPSHGLRGVKVTAFDTRVAVEDVNSRIGAFFINLFGFAAGRIAVKLTKSGGALVVPAEGFCVMGREGPLKAGEPERATAWARQIAAQV